MASADAPIRMHVHERDDARVDGVLRLIEAAARPEPLPRVLQAMCEQVAVIAHADVVSVYVREPADDVDWLVMRANVGFPSEAVGSVRLAMGEGITGTAAEVMRPISASRAQGDEHYKHFPVLGEERFPSLLAIPLLLHGAVAGVLVLQRTEESAFTDAEVALATALATTFGHALEHRGEVGRAPARSARLMGTSLAPGQALGRAVLLGTLEAIRHRITGVPEPGAHALQSFAAIEDLLRKAKRTVADTLPRKAAREVESLSLVLDDQRLRDRIQTLCNELGIVGGLRQVAREYAAASFGAGDEELREARAAEVEALCLLVATHAAERPLPTAGTVLVVAERLSLIMSLAVVGCRGDAVVAAGRLVPDEAGISVARAAGVPVVGGIAGLFAWVQPEDTLLVDATDPEHGVLRVNPPATRLARFRHERE